MHHSVFDAGVLDRQVSMYQGWAAPDVVKDQPQPRLSNWHPEDLAAYCGGEFVTNNRKERA